jgi:hypothetical protein
MPALGYQALALALPDAATPCLYYQLINFSAGVAWMSFTCDAVGLHGPLLSMRVN